MLWRQIIQSDKILGTFKEFSVFCPTNFFLIMTLNTGGIFSISFLEIFKILFLTVKLTLWSNKQRIWITCLFILEWRELKFDRPPVYHHVCSKKFKLNFLEILINTQQVPMFFLRYKSFIFITIFLKSRIEKLHQTFILMKLITKPLIKF